MNNEELILSVREISKALNDVSAFDIISIVVSVLSLAATIYVMVLNHKAVEATKESVEATKESVEVAKQSVEVAEKSIALTKLEMQKAIDIQLYEKRLEVAKHIEKNDYCDTTMEIVLLFGKDTYLKIEVIKELLHEKAQWERAHTSYDGLLDKLRDVDEGVREYEDLEATLNLRDDSMPPEKYEEYSARYQELNRKYSVLYEDTPDGEIAYDINEICHEETRLDQEIIAMQKSLKAHVLKVMRQKLSLEAD